MIKLLILLVSSMQAAPAPPETHALHLARRGDVNMPFYYPESIVTVKNMFGSALRPLAIDEKIALAKKTLVNGLNITDRELQVMHYFIDRVGVTHVYVDRLINNVPIANQNAIVHIKNGLVASYSSSFRLNSRASNFMPAVRVKEPTIVVSLAQATRNARSQLGAPRDGTNATLAYVQVPSGELVYAHQFQLRDDAKVKWYQVSVDAHNGLSLLMLGQVVEVVDFYNKASYHAIKLPNATPLDGFTTIVDPADKNASPFGWHNDGRTSHINTVGNNVDVHVDRAGWFYTAFRPSSINHQFDSNWKANEDVKSRDNLQASAVNLFYLINSIHDIAYQYGFTENSGNFQMANNNRGGTGGDRVIANDISILGTNNANFATPPDGQPGVMVQYDLL